MYALAFAIILIIAATFNSNSQTVVLAIAVPEQQSAQSSNTIGKIFLTVLSCGQSQYLPICVKVKATQIVGSVASAGFANGLIANAKISVTALKPGTLPVGVQISADKIMGIVSSSSSLTCSTNSSPNVIPSCYEFDGTLSNSVVVPASQVCSVVSSASSLTCPTGAADNSAILPSCFAVNAHQVIGNSDATKLTGALNPSVTAQGNQVTNGVIPTSVTFDGQFGSNAKSAIVHVLGCSAPIVGQCTFTWYEAVYAPGLRYFGCNGVLPASVAKNCNSFRFTRYVVSEQYPDRLSGCSFICTSGSFTCPDPGESPVGECVTTMS